MDVDAGTLLDTVTPLDAGTLRGTEAIARRRGQDGLSPSVDVMATRRTDGEELELDIHRRFLESIMAKGGDTHCCNERACHLQLEPHGCESTNPSPGTSVPIVSL